jgi:hypothetical protein
MLRLVDVSRNHKALIPSARYPTRDTQRFAAPVNYVLLLGPDKGEAEMPTSKKGLDDTAGGGQHATSEIPSYTPRHCYATRSADSQDRFYRLRSILL